MIKWWICSIIWWVEDNTSLSLKYCLADEQNQPLWGILKSILLDNKAQREVYRQRGQRRKTLWEPRPSGNCLKAMSGLEGGLFRAGSINQRKEMIREFPGRKQEWVGVRVMIQKWYRGSRLPDPPERMVYFWTSLYEDQAS